MEDNATGKSNERFRPQVVLLWTLSVLLALAVCPCLPLPRGGGSFIAQSLGRWRNVGLAIGNFQDAHGPAELLKRQQETGLSWRVHILPYIEHDDLYQRFDLTQPWDSPHNLSLLKEMPNEYQMDGQRLENVTRYRLVHPNVLVIPYEQEPLALRGATVGPTWAIPWTQPDPVMLPKELAGDRYGTTLLLWNTGNVEKCPESKLRRVMAARAAAGVPVGSPIMVQEIDDP